MPTPAQIKAQLINNYMVRRIREEKPFPPDQEWTGSSDGLTSKEIERLIEAINKRYIVVNDQ